MKFKISKILLLAYVVFAMPIAVRAGTVTVTACPSYNCQSIGGLTVVSFPEDGVVIADSIGPIPGTLGLSIIGASIWVIGDITSESASSLGIFLTSTRGEITIDGTGGGGTIVSEGVTGLTLQASTNVSLISATIVTSTGTNAILKGVGDISISGSNIFFGNELVVNSTGGNITAKDILFVSDAPSSEITLTADGNINISGNQPLPFPPAPVVPNGPLLGFKGMTVGDDVTLTAGGKIIAHDSDIRGRGVSSDIIMRAEVSIDVDRSFFQDVDEIVEFSPEPLGIFTVVAEP